MVVFVVAGRISAEHVRRSGPLRLYKSSVRAHLVPMHCGAYGHKVGRLLHSTCAG
jgi:hypothetical protein